MILARVSSKTPLTNAPSPMFASKCAGMCRWVPAFLMLVAAAASAQIKQTAVYEQLHKGSEHDFIVVAMADHGLALVRDTEKFEKGKKSWEVVFLDTALNESWQSKFEVDHRMNLLGYDYYEGKLCLLFKEHDLNSRDINLVEFEPHSQTFVQHQFKPEAAIHFSHFSILKNKAILAGYLNTEPIVLMYDLQQESAKVVPGVFQKKVELMDVRVNSNATFNILLVDRGAAIHKNLVLRTYDGEGVMLVEDVIPIDEGKSILDAKSSALVRDELMILGTWTQGSNKQAAGLFSVVVDPFSNQKINYYNLTDLNHFLDQFKPKKAARIRAHAENRKSRGKAPDFRNFVSALKIVETNDGFVMLGEVYEASNTYYNTRPGSPYYYPSPGFGSPYYGYPYGINSMPYRYGNPYGATPYGSSGPSLSSDPLVVQAVVSVFDARGNLVGDHALKLENTRSNTKEQVSDFNIADHQMIMAYRNEKEITIRIDAPDGTNLHEEKLKPALKNEHEEIRYESQDNGGLRNWYGPYFYVYGFHTLKDNTTKELRDVFYINKIEVR